jgi:predicted RNA-binding Zn ribbon-like protein
MKTSAAVEVLPAPQNALAIDFANTRYWRGSGAPTETLLAPADLLDWVGTTALVSPAMLRRFRAAWTATEFARAIAWREAIFRGLAAASGGETPDAADVALLNDAMAQAPTRRRLSPDGRGWEVGALPPRAASLLAPVLWSAGDLLLGPKLARVRQCANPSCRFLFLDDSKAGNRLWCSMSSCGNRAKAHRHYLRRKGTASAQ